MTWSSVRRALLVLCALVAVVAGSVAVLLGLVAYDDCRQEESATCGSDALQDAAPYALLGAAAVMVFVLLVVDLVGARRRARAC